MARPRQIPVVDLMLAMPNAGGGMGLDAARKMTRDKSTEQYTAHPAQYLFKDAVDIASKGGDVDDVVAMMDEFGVGIAQISVDASAPETALEIFERHPTRFFGSVGVDPNGGMDAIGALERTVNLHPNVKSASFYPCLVYPQVPLDDKKAYPLYAKCCELDIPINVLVGVPGPRVPYACQHPGLLDEVAWFFPDLKIVMRHGGDPWTDLCVKLLLKWPNLYYSTSAWAPKHYPKNILDFANKRGADKVMYAGYFPGLSYERIFGEMDDLPLRDETWPPFLRDNAVRVYGLEDLLG